MNIEIKLIIIIFLSFQRNSNNVWIQTFLSTAWFVNET